MEKNSTAKAAGAFARPDIGPCIEWAYGKFGTGYGQLRLEGVPAYVHRLSYCDFNGLTLDDIRGVVIRHRCDNPACFNPLHLIPGTQADNMRDMNERGRQVTPRGTRNQNAKLTDEIVRAIRVEFQKGTHAHGAAALGRKYGVDEKTIWAIIDGRTWTHVGEAA